MTQTTLGCTVKLATWQPQLIPLSEQERDWIRQVIVEAVFSIWNTEHRPTNLQEIFNIYVEKCKKEKVRIRKKRTVDRRVNEAASLEFGARIVSNTSGMYQPNPRLFEVEWRKVCGETEK
jgi:hypothetical protein